MWLTCTNECALMCSSFWNNMTISSLSWNLKQIQFYAYLWKKTKQNSCSCLLIASLLGPMKERRGERDRAWERGWLAYDFFENLRRLELSCFDFFPEPAKADVIVCADKLPAQHSAGVADVKLKLTCTASSNDHSLHLLSAGLCQICHVVLLRYIATKTDLYSKESPNS